MTEDAFADKVIHWQQKHGRHHLPWQLIGSPYAVWLSEVMLQQTQVETVIPYFRRFLKHFASLSSLAAGSLDEVLSLWSGLGYYARARNLHKTAQLVVNDYGGAMPSCVDELQKLPGIGRSTAGAIVSLAMQQRAPILDGNVKRIFCRHFLIDGWPGKSIVQKKLWALAETLLPKQTTRAYNQGLMDLGATICTRSQPRCHQCPLQQSCQAFKHDKVQQLPTGRIKTVKPIRPVKLLLCTTQENFILLEKRPSPGVWGGLWSFPMLTLAEQTHQWCKQVLGALPSTSTSLPILQHSLTHFHFEFHPQLLFFKGNLVTQTTKKDRLWYNLQAPQQIGLPAPVSHLLEIYHDKISAL